MRITVLGKSPAWQDAGGACSGYLIEEGDACVLLDCGSGVFSKLRLYRDYTRVDAVLLSHMHPDHFLDVVPFAFALLYAPRQQPVAVDRWRGTDSPARPTIFAPAGASETLGQIAAACGLHDLITRAFEVHEYDPGETLAVGPLRVRFHGVPHYLPTCAVEIAPAAGGGRITYGADHAPCETLAEFAAGTDLLMLEATLARREDHVYRGHLTPSEAGEHARAAGARRLVLTHISDELDALWARAEAARAYDGPVEVAREGVVYTV